MSLIHRFRLFLLHRQADALLRRIRKRRRDDTIMNSKPVQPDRA